MTDFDLESKLRSAPVPERPDEYWNGFPSRIRVQLRRNRTEPAPGRVWRIRLTWAFDFALTAALVMLCLEYHPLQFAAKTCAQHERRFHAQLAQLDAGLHKLVLNTDGMGYLLAEAN
jgi:hypothetical protein